MKGFDLKIKDKDGASVFEGSILGIISTKRKGYSKNGILIKKKVVFGKANTRNDTIADYIGFWAVNMEQPNTDLTGDINHYEDVNSIQYLINSSKAEVCGSVYEEEKEK